MSSRQHGQAYKGPVVFVDGVHYPCNKEGHAIKDRGLRWQDGKYVFAADDAPLHNDAYHKAEVELAPGGEG